MNGSNCCNAPLRARTGALSVTLSQPRPVGIEAEDSSRFNSPDEPKTSPLDLPERPLAVWTGDLSVSY
jgi:hypothetical protein